MKKNVVYFIQGFDGGPIKINTTSRLDKTLKKIQINSPIELRVLCFVLGSETVESYLHKRFRGSRLHGDWFEPTDDLVSLTKMIKASPQEIDNLVSFIHLKYGIHWEDAQEWSKRKSILLKLYKHYQIKQQSIKLGVPDPFPASNSSFEFPEWFLAEIDWELLSEVGKL